MKATVLAYTYTEVLRTLRKRLREPAPARAQILSGPRQVGKTTLLGEIAAEWPGRPVSPVWLALLSFEWIIAPTGGRMRGSVCYSIVQSGNQALAAGLGAPTPA